MQPNADLAKPLGDIKLYSNCEGDNISSLSYTGSPSKSECKDRDSNCSPKTKGEQDHSITQTLKTPKKETRLVDLSIPLESTWDYITKYLLFKN